MPLSSPATTVLRFMPQVLPIPRFFLVVLVLLVFSAGCKSSSGIVDRDANMPAGYPNHSAAEISQLIRVATLPADAYQSESALAVRSPVQSGSFSASISHRRNDSLMISISPGLGIVAVKALVTPDSFYVFDRINKELVIGTLEDMQRLLPLPSESDVLYRSMLGIWVPETTEDWELTADKGYYTLKEPGNRRILFIDPVYWRVVRYIENNPDGSLLEERTFAEFEDFDGMYLPRRLTFRRPGDDTSASLYHRKLTLNPSALTFDFSVSNTVRRSHF